MVSDAPYKADEREASIFSEDLFCPFPSMFPSAICWATSDPDETGDISMRHP